MNPTLPRLFAGCALRCALLVSLAVVIPCRPAAHAADGATATIAGRVLNGATGAYLESAVVAVEGSTVQTVTARGGEFSLNLPAGRHTLHVSFTGLDPITETVDLAPGAVVTKEFALTSGIYRLEPVTVTGLREGSALALQQQRLAENFKTVAATDTFGNPAANPGELLQRLPGVTIDVRAGEATGMYIRGLGTSFISLLMDGNNVAASIGTSAARDFNLAQLATNNIASAEVIRAPLPEHQANAIAGYVNLVTRRAFDSAGRRTERLPEGDRELHPLVRLLDSRRAGQRFRWPVRRIYAVHAA